MIRELSTSPIDQGKNEVKSYDFPFADWGTPTTPTVVLKDDFGNDITSTNVTGSASVASTTVTTGLVSGLKAGFRYWLFCKVVISGETFEQWCEIHCTE